VSEPNWQFHSNPKTVLKVLKVFLRSPNTQFNRATLKAEAKINNDWLYDCIATLLEQKRIEIVTKNGQRFYQLKEAVAIAKEKTGSSNRAYSELLTVWWKDIRPTVRGSVRYGYLRSLPQ
jgi:hypothetical protein